MVQHYAEMARILSQDSTEGLAADAKVLAQALTPEGRKEPMMAAKALATLQRKDLDIKEARAAFKDLSNELIPALEAHYPQDAGETEWAVYHCEMAPGSWVQSEGKAHNPYYGSEMLRCGKKVAVLGHGESMEKMEDHGKTHDENPGS